MKSYYVSFLLILITFCGPSDQEVQAQIDAAVNSALETTTTTSTTTTLAPTTTTTTSTTTTTLAPTTTTTTSTTTTTLAPTTTIQNLKTYKWRATAYDVDGNLYQGATSLYEIEGQPGKCEFNAKYPDSDKVYSLYFRQRMVFYDANQNVLKTITVEELGEFIYGPYYDEYVGYKDGTSDIPAGYIGCRFIGTVDLPYSEYYYWSWGVDGVMIGPYSQDDFNENNIRGFALQMSP